MSLLSKFLNTKNIYSKRKLQYKVSLQIILGKNVDKTKILKTSSPFTPSPPKRPLDVLRERIDLCAAPKTCRNAS